MIEYVYRRRVRYRECDPMGRVYHTHYLDYFEEARTEALRSFGLAYRSLEEEGILMPVTEAELRFRGAAAYDDLLAVHTRFPERPRSRVGIEYEVRRAKEDSISDGTSADDAADAGDTVLSRDAERILVTGRVELCFLDRARQRPVRAPETIRRIFAELARGDSDPSDESTEPRP